MKFDKSRQKIYAQLSRILYIIRDILRARKIDPVVHQAYRRFVLPGNQPVSTFLIHSPFVLDLHAVSLIETVLQIGNNAAEGLQRLTLAGDDQLPVNAPQ